VLLNVQLSALQDQGKLNILSSPSITTLDNQTAYIESGQDIPFQTVEDGEVNIEYKKATLRLTVTPHVIDDKTLKMFINVHKDEPDFSQTVLGNPTIITKNAETNVIQFDGQTIVIGGLNKETTNDSKTGVPLLEDIPGLGYLFKRKSAKNGMEDLLIFITPHILKPRKSSG
jgi:type IV pilus assembly protein PilQ